MMAAEVLVFLGLVYLLILQDGAVGDSREIRCAGCGHTRRGPESGVNLLAWFGTFSNIIDRCPECGRICPHVVENTESQG